MRNLMNLPANLPAPEDDGAANHLVEKAIPDLVLINHENKDVSLRENTKAKTVLFIFPRAGNTIRPNLHTDDWDLIPGARGCTPQSCGFRDLSKDFEAQGYNVFGLSVQRPEILREIATKNHLPFQLLSDSALELTKALRLPTFDFHGETLIKRMVLLIENGKIFRVFLSRISSRP